MTGFHTATNRAEPLSVASLERSAALFTMHCRFMAYAGMMAGYRAWAAVGRTSRRLRATVGAMLGVLAGRAKLAPVFCFVAGHAEGYPVVYVKHQFGVLRSGYSTTGAGGYSTSGGGAEGGGSRYAAPGSGYSTSGAGGYSTSGDGGGGGG